MIKEVIPAMDSKPELLSSDYSFMSAIHYLGGSPHSGHYTADPLRPVQDAKDHGHAHEGGTSLVQL
jgi:hypothetical protein